MSDTPSTKLAVIVHADVVGSTALVQANETLAHQRIQDTFSRLSETITAHGGTAHEIRGDALVAEFAKASDAVSASIEFQAANIAHNEELGDDIRAAVRVGIAMGEVVVADNTVTGEGVVLAQRLEQLAEPGGVCIQGAAYETVPKRLPFEYENLGERKLKGFEEPVRVYMVRHKGSAGKPESAQTGSLVSITKPSIAVLPFANMSGAEPVNDFETLTFAIYCTRSPVVGLGGLIQTVSGSGLGSGHPRTKRSGCAAHAFSKMRRRCSIIACARPW